MIGETILHYKILEKLGEGGMGVVYLAEDTKLKRQVAIKFLPHQISANEEERKRFEIEAQAAAVLNHPNITTIYSIEETEKEIFIVMEYIKGVELKEQIKSGTISPDDTIKISTQMAEGLKAAHNEGITHRDIKSSNIMITNDGNVKIMDFGLAKLKGGSELTKIGTTIGTVSYMSPEQARGEEVDNRSDIWSFGVVLYEMLTGKQPFKGEYDHAIIYSIINESPMLTSESDSGEESRLQKIIKKCLQKNRDDRYQNFGEVISDLRSAKQEDAAKESIPVITKQAVSEKPIKRSLKKFIIPATLFAAIIAIAIIYLFNSNEEKPETIGRIPVAVADFVNLTGEKELDALSGMLITSLEQSRKLAVMSRSRMFDVLTQLNKSNASAIDETLGREICRQANIHALILPTIRKFGNVYSVDLKVLNPQEGEYLFTLNERDKGQEEIPPLIDRLSEKTRMELEENEAEIKTANQKVGEITTPNLDAYQHYFKGEEYLNKIQLDSAKEEFSKAIELDSTFGLAYYRLAYAMGWNSEQLSDKPLQKALQYIDRIPEKERYLVRAEQLRQEQGFAAGIPILKEMEKFYPHDKEMLFNIGDWAFHSEDYKTAKEYFDKLLAIAPHHQRTLYHYSSTLTKYYSDPDYFSGSLNLALQKAKDELKNNADSVNINLALAMIYLKMEKYEKAEEQIHNYAVNLEKYFEELSDPSILYSVYIYSGKYRRAIELINRGIEKAKQQQDIPTQVYSYLIEGDYERLGALGKASVKNTIQKIPPLLKRQYVPYAWENIAGLYASIGDYKRAGTILKIHTGQGAALPQIILLSSREECDEAQTIFDNFKNFHIPVYIKLRCMYALGKCYMNSGDLKKAEKIILEAQAIISGKTEPFRAMYHPRTFYWLGKIYEQMGKKDKAIKNYEKFLKLLGKC